MELAIPLVALGGMYVVSNQKESVKPANYNQNKQNVTSVSSIFTCNWIRNLSKLSFEILNRNPFYLESISCIYRIKCTPWSIYFSVMLSLWDTSGLQLPYNIFNSL